MEPRNTTSNNPIAKRLLAAIAGALILGSVWVTGAVAGQPVKADYFGRSTNTPDLTPSNPAPTMAVPAAVTGDSRTPATRWFETFDEVVAIHRPSSADRVILSRYFQQKAERVIEWTNIAGKVAKDYRECAKMLKAVPVDGSLTQTGKRGSSLLELRNLTADWYDDAASVLEDYIKPRRPARSIEELDGLLAQMHSRSQGLAKMTETLKMMDSDLRSQFNVHPPRYDDAIATYARRVPQPH